MQNAFLFPFFHIFVIFVPDNSKKKKNKSQKMTLARRAMQQKGVHILIRAGM